MPADDALRALDVNDKTILKALLQMHKLQEEGRLWVRDSLTRMEAELRELRAEVSAIRAEADHLRVDIFDTYRHLAPLKPLVVCCGMIRSGSTLQYQVVADLLEQRGLGQRAGFVEKKNFRQVRAQLENMTGLSVIKIHDFLPEIEPWLKLEKTKIFYTFRDLRSVAASVMRIWKAPFSDVIRPNGWLDSAVAADARWRAFPGVTVSRYEDLVQSLPSEVGRWATALGLELTPQEVEDVSARFSIPAQQERIRQAGLPEEGAQSSAIETFDPKSLLHARHITDGSEEGWKKELSPDQIKQIEDQYSGWLQQHGFPFVTRS
jgi:hypothetical protein